MNKTNIKIVSWNVNSIRKGVYSELDKLIIDKDPDIICFQETKGTEEDIEFSYQQSYATSNFPYRYYNDSIKGQAGVAVWSKIKAVSVLKEIPRLFQLKEGRVLVLEFQEGFTLLNTYVPNTGREIAEKYRQVWHNSLMNWLPKQLEKNFIWCGDLNVVSEPRLDTSHHTVRPTKNISPGLKVFEKEHLDEYINLGLYDVFRHKYPDLVSFTWFSMKRNDVGLRLDYFLTNEQILDRIEEIIHGKKLGNLVSDHTWIMITLNC